MKEEARGDCFYVCVCVYNMYMCVFPSFSTVLCFPPLPSSYLTAEHNKCSFIYI